MASVSGTGAPAVGAYYSDVRIIADPESVPLSSLARRILDLHRAPGLPLAAERR